MFVYSPKKLTGFYIFIAGLSILLKVIFPSMNNFYLLSFLSFFISLNLIFISLKNDKRRKMIIPGVIFLLLTLFLFFYFFILYKYFSMKKIWPIMGLFPSIALVIYYYKSLSKSPAIIIPGIFIGIISIVIFIKNNTDLKVNFASFMMILIASMLIIIGLFLIFQNQIDMMKKKKSLKYVKKI